MIEFVDTTPDVSVQQAEYQRLLGYPRDHEMSDRALELVERTRQWYAANGRPWFYARQAESVAISGNSIDVDGETFSSKGVQVSLEQAEADGLFLFAVSAGEEIELEARRRWRDEKPDEYFFLEVYGSAVVEHLVTICGARLCAWAESQRMAALPHISPGYTDWDVSQQSQLLRLIRSQGRRELPGRLDALPSGMLRPKKSLLGFIGVTRHTEHVSRLAVLNSCERCSFLPCQYRRAPYQRARRFPGISLSAPPVKTAADVARKRPALDGDASYTVNRRALSRWATERLTLRRRDDGAIDALFRFEGTTCTNLGRRLLFDYQVTLGTEQQGFAIRSQRCAPAPDDDGYKSMCGYLDKHDDLMLAIGGERPLLGQPLNDVLAWDIPVSAAGCYCELTDRMHKWRIVLETIHFTLVQQATGGLNATCQMAGVP